MKDLAFPLNLTFKITTLHNDFVAHDANGQIIAFVRQKLLKLVEEVSVYSDETRASLSHTIRANKWIDFSATYTFTDAKGTEIGRVARKGWSSLWKTHYEIFDEKQAPDLVIREDDPWIKVADAVLKEIPLLNILSGYFFNPSYSVSRPDGKKVVQLKKEPSFFGRSFSVTKLTEFETGEEERIVLSLMMMILLERRKG